MFFPTFYVYMFYVTETHTFLELQLGKGVQRGQSLLAEAPPGKRYFHLSLTHTCVRVSDALTQQDTPFRWVPAGTRPSVRWRIMLP